MNKYDGYKLCFIDVETTGTDPKRHNIFQLSARITDSTAENVLDQINLTFVPHSLDEYENGALEKTGYSLDDMRNLSMSSEEAYSKFVTFCDAHVSRFDKKDKMHFVAYNAQFDSNFVREWFAKNGNPYYGSYFWNPPLCVMIGAAWLTQGVRGALPDFKLGTLCQSAELGWNEDHAHDASYDINKTVELYRYLNQFFG
jgi:DNA polymerase III alpha subunit (gram-positive type)